MQRELEIRLAEGKSVRLDVKKSTVAEFASAFIDEAVARVRGGAGAGQTTNVERLAEEFLMALDEEVTYSLARFEPAEKELLLEWLVTAIVGGYGQDFLRRFVRTLLAEKPGAGGGGGDTPPEGGSAPTG